MTKRQNKKTEFMEDVVYVLASIFSIAFLMGSIIFLGFAENKGREETISYMQKSAEQSKYAINNEITEIFHTLSAAALLTESMQPEELRDRGASFYKLGKENNFLRFGFVDLENKAEYVDFEGELNRENNSLMADLMDKVARDKWVVSDTVRDRISGVDVNYYLVPAYRNGEIIGAVYAVCPVNELRSVMESALFGGKGFSHIINGSGEYIVRSNNPAQTSTSSRSIFDTDPPVPEDDQKRIFDNMANGRSGVAYREIPNDSLIICYEPLGVNDWYVMYVVSENQIDESYSLMMNGVTILILTTVMLFIVFIFLIRQINEKNRTEMEKLAYTDPLTGYGNHQKFMMDAQEILDKSNGKKYSFWYYDIKNFKYVNDIFGYAVGDHVLKYWAKLFKEDIREDEAFARVGADNFVCLRSYEEVEDIRKRFGEDAEFLADFKETTLNGYTIEISAGIYLVNGEDGNLSLNDMQDRANIAQKKAKSMIGSHYSIYSNEIRERILRETEMETHWATALEEGEFELYLQPKIDIQHGNRVGGMEALVRWNWPGKGLIPPAEFIPLFERNGFIVKLDQYMLELACKKYREYFLSGQGAKSVISVNVSRLCLMQPDFIDTYTAIRDKYEIPDGSLELEFTESVAFENFELFRKTIGEFRKRGFLCSIDDFGSGHSSLNMLKNLEVDVLKLDRMFFVPGDSEERDSALIRSIIDMAIALGIKTVAEGVESEKQVTMLRRMGCDMVQGFVFARPMPIDNFRKYIKDYDSK